MEGKLIKKENHYYFWSSDWNPNKNKGFVANSEGTVDYKLSKENCDEIFGVVDVDNICDEYFINEYSWNGKNILPYKDSDLEAIKNDFIHGYDKAMELNKDKLFTVEDMKQAYIQGKHGGKTQSYVEFDDFIKSLQQSTDMLVEIHASCIWTQIDVIDPITFTCKSHISKGDKEEPILDENGCLILRRIKC
jgi:hypothetical protein